MSGRLIIIENDDEKFSKTTCSCSFCTSTHVASAEWNTFVPETILQKNMMETISKIEKREEERIRLDERKSKRLRRI